MGGGNFANAMIVGDAVRTGALTATPRSKSKFKMSEVERALKAAKKAGVEVERLEITEDGRIILVARESETDASGARREIVL